MRPIYYLHLLIVGWVLSGCVPSSSVTIQTPTFFQPTSTSIVIPSKTATLTPPPTLNPEQAQDTIKTLLQEPVDCPAPCFWGIIPGRTTLGETTNILTRLGLEINNITSESKNFYNIAYNFDGGISMDVTLTVVNALVTDMQVDIHPEPQKPDTTRKWLAYSPETLIKRYGSPSKVDFFVGGGPNPLYLIDMYFDKVDLIIHYDSYGINPNGQICPLTDQIDNVRIWLGKNPMNPPNYASEVVSLEEATSLTIEEFSSLMTSDPKKACFNFDEKKIP